MRIHKQAKISVEKRIDNFFNSIDELKMYRVVNSLSGGYDIEKLAIETWGDKNGALIWAYESHTKNRRRAIKAIKASGGNIA